MFRSILSHIDLHAAGKLLQAGAHDRLQDPEGLASRAVAGIKGNVGVPAGQTPCQFRELFRGFKRMPVIRVQQMEPADDGVHRPWTGVQDVLQAVVRAACIEHTIDIESHLVREIIRDQAAFPTDGTNIRILRHNIKHGDFQCVQKP